MIQFGTLFVGSARAEPRLRVLGRNSSGGTIGCGRVVDVLTCGAYVGGLSRGDHFPTRTLLLLVARGFFFGLSRLLPGVMFQIERLAAFPDGEDQVQQFSHDVSQRNISAGSLRPQALVQRAAGRIVSAGAHRRVVEVMAYQAVAFLRHPRCGSRS